MPFLIAPGPAFRWSGLIPQAMETPLEAASVRGSRVVVGRTGERVGGVAS